MDAEVTGGREWLATLDEAIRIAPDETKKVVSRGALQIKKDWRKRWTGYPHIPVLPYAIGYDVEANGVGASAEIGPDKDKKQGPLGNLIEFGSVNNSPIPGGLPALQAEGPRFEKALADMAVKLLEG